MRGPPHHWPVWSCRLWLGPAGRHRFLSTKVSQGSARRELDACLRCANDQGRRQIRALGSEPEGPRHLRGRRSILIMIFRSDVPKFASNNMNDVTPEESRAAMQGMTANFGTWSIDEATKTLTTNIEAAYLRI